MLSIALRFWHSDPTLPEIYQESPLDWADHYCQTAAKCLTAGDITNPLKGTLEACIMFLHAGFTHNRNDITRTWLMAGDILRLAMRMGYHRDPSQYPHLSAFEGEMRRRVFQFVYQTDLLCSFQIGLAPAVHGIEYDAQPAQNYHESQLSPVMASLPPALDSSEPTYYSYFVAQNRLFRVFGDIVEQLNAITSLPYPKVLDLSGRLDNAFDQIPPHLKRTLPDSATDSPRLVLQRIELELFYHKVNCVLHRRYMTLNSENPEYKHSRRGCINSALRIITCQVAVHSNERWPHVEWWTSSFTLHDFTLAGTVLCLYLSRCKEEAYKSEEVANIRLALATSHALWFQVRDTSPDARRAFDVLDGLRIGLEGCQSIQPSLDVLARPHSMVDPQLVQLGRSTNTTGNLEHSTIGLDFGAMNESEIDWVCCHQGATLRPPLAD